MIRVMLVEDSDSDATLTQEALKEATREEFECFRVATLTQAVQYCQTHMDLFDVILLDLGLPESQGLATLSAWFLQVGYHLPVIVLSGLSDRTVMIEAIQMGAQDYIEKGEIVPGVLCRTLRYTTERHRTTEEHTKRAMEELEKAQQKLIEVIDALHVITLSAGERFYTK